MMSAKSKKGPLVPRLRFPEFRDAGEWESKKLDDICTRILQKVTDDSLVPVSITAGQGFVSQESKFGKNISGAQYKNYIFLKYGDFAYNKGNSKKFPQGYVCQLKEFEQAAASSAFLCFRFTIKYQATFFQSLFDNNIHGKQLVKYITSSARSDGLLNIKPDIFFSILLPVPHLYSEQQRIADCLSSLDERIAAETNKLDTLKDHKRGLLKQLFPTEGEMLPQLRFPEFRDTGEWGINLLGQISENLDNRRVPITENMRIRGAIPYYGASGIVDYVNDFIFDEELLCISEDGANLITRTAPIAFSISGKSWVNNHAHVLKFSSRARQKLIEEYINFIKIDDFLTGMAQPKLNKSKIEVIPIPIPPTEKEEQKIADCLSSLDELIAAQTQKINLLKDHKKGLMQQLFPCIDEVQA